MYKKENNSWLKHIDFVILDILCLQLAFILAYEIRVAKGIPYLNPLYENMAFVLVIFQLLVSFFGESFSGVLRRGFLIEMKCMIEHEICVMLLAVRYLYREDHAGKYSDHSCQNSTEHIKRNHCFDDAAVGFSCVAQ